MNNIVKVHPNSCISFYRCPSLGRQEHKITHAQIQKPLHNREKFLAIGIKTVCQDDVTIWIQTDKTKIRQSQWLLSSIGLGMFMADWVGNVQAISKVPVKPPPPIFRQKKNVD